MKIAVVGCGALGSYYGGKLHQAYHEVHFLLRTDFEQVKRSGVEVHSPQGNFHFRPRCARHPEEIGVCELVIVSLKTTANDQLETLIRPLIDPQTQVLCLQNGLGNVESLATFIPKQQILGGLCFICVNRPRPGLIHHLDHGQIVIGEADGWPEPRTHDLAKFFRNSGVPCKVTDDLNRAQWEKLVWNIPFNGLGVAGAFGYEFFHSSADELPTAHKAPLTTDQLIDNPQWLSCVRSLMNEIVAVANQLGYPVKTELIDRMIQNTKSMKDYHPSTVIDFERGKPLEYESMFGRPLALAQTTTTAIPTLERLCWILQHLATPSANRSN